MTTNYHTPHVYAEALTSANVNSPLSELDSAIGDVVTELRSRDFNVMNYGAVGDGVANDAVAIQNAVNAAVDAGGATVYLPAGTYKLGTTTIWLTGNGTSTGTPAPVSIVGSGDATTVTYTGTGDAFSGGTSGSGYSGSVAFMDFQLDGTGSTGNARGIYLKRIYRPVTITRMQISDFAFAGVHLYRCYGAVIRDSRIGSCGWNVLMDNANGASMFGNRIVTGVNGGVRLFKNGRAVGTLSADSIVGATNIKVSSVTGLIAGDTIQIGAATTRDVREIQTVGTVGAGGTGITLTAALTYAHSTGDDFSEIVTPYDETGTASANYTIVGGTIEDCAGPGISIEQVSQAYIAGVYIEGNGSATVGQIVAGGENGGSGGTASRGILITGNRFQGAGNGATVTGSAGGPWVADFTYTPVLTMDSSLTGGSGEGVSESPAGTWTITKGTNTGGTFTLSVDGGPASAAIAYDASAATVETALDDIIYSKYAVQVYAASNVTITSNWSSSHVTAAYRLESGTLEPISIFNNYYSETAEVSNYVTIGTVQTRWRGTLYGETNAWVNFDEHSSSPATPDTGRVHVYPKTNGKMYSMADDAIERDMSAQVVCIPFRLSSSPGTATVQMKMSDAASGFVSPRLPCPWTGSIIGISARLSTAWTAGTLDIEAMVNASATGFKVTFGDATAFKTNKQADTLDTFDTTDAIGVQAVGTGFTPTAAEIDCWLFVKLNVDV